MSRLILKILLTFLCINTSIYSEDFETNSRQVDGFGSQFQHAITCAVYAELHNKEFRYTPFTQMEHNYDNDPLFLERTTYLFGTHPCLIGFLYMSFCDKKE